MELPGLVDEERRDTRRGCDSGAAFRSHHEKASVERVGDDSARRDYGDASRSARGIAGAWIEDVVVAAAVDGEESLVVAGGRDGFVAQLDSRERARATIGILHRDLPGPIAVPSARRDVSARGDEHVANAARD